MSDRTTRWSSTGEAEAGWSLRLAVQKHGIGFAGMQAPGCGDHARVMGEQDHLHTSRNVGQHLEHRGRTFVVEMHEAVVEDQRQRIGPLRMAVFQRRQAKGQIDLITSAFAHVSLQHGLGRRFRTDGVEIVFRQPNLCIFSAGDPLE